MKQALTMNLMKLSTMPTMTVKQEKAVAVDGSIRK